MKAGDKSNDFLQTSTDKLIQAHKLDKYISHLLQSAVTYKPTDNIPFGYCCLDNGVLMRPGTEPSDQEWHIRNQIVLPKPCRRHVENWPMTLHYQVTLVHVKQLCVFWSICIAQVLFRM